LVRNLTTPVQIKCILAAQWLITICIAGVLFVVNRNVALSAFLGGLVCVLPNMYFARQTFRTRNAQAQSLLWSIYFAELIKIILAVALFVIVFIKYKELHPLVFFITYFVAQSCMWLVPALLPTFKKLFSN